MSVAGAFELFVYLALLALCLRPLGGYMARVYQREATPLDRVLAPVSRLIYRAGAIDPDEEMSWKKYAASLLLFHIIGFVVVFGVQRAQSLLPMNPQELGAVAPDLAFNTAMSFTTNTNWQSYAGETTLSYFTQAFALTVQNFVSAASGMAVLMALLRAFSRASTKDLGNFWVDVVRGTLYILLPLSIIVALLLVSQGVVQSLLPYPTVKLLEPAAVADGTRITDQVLPLGPAASQIAIKQLGTNGGGFFSVNSAHPFENPTPISNFVEVTCILLLPVALCQTFGKVVGDTRQGRALLATMTIVFLAMLTVCVSAELRGNPAFGAMGIDDTASALSSGGNMEGKEVRSGAFASALWAVATTAASNGSVNSMHDSFMPLGGLSPLWMMELGEVIFGGVGSGLYGMLCFAVIAVFVAGLMVGRTPEYLGKKVEAFEMKMATLAILLPSATVLVGTAFALSSQAGLGARANPGPHGFTEILYAFSSGANNNGSAFAGLQTNDFLYNTALGIAMFVGRFFVIIPVLAMAGSLASKKRVPAGAGTLATHTPLFVVMLLATIVVVGALTFFPALALGPIVEHLLMKS